MTFCWKPGKDWHFWRLSRVAKSAREGKHNGQTSCNHPPVAFLSNPAGVEAEASYQHTARIPNASHIDSSPVSDNTHSSLLISPISSATLMRFSFMWSVVILDLILAMKCAPDMFSLVSGEQKGAIISLSRCLHLTLRHLAFKIVYISIYYFYLAISTFIQLYLTAFLYM